MYNFKVGIMVDSLRMDIKEGIKKAKELGADGIQIYAVDGPMEPANLDRQKRHELFDYITSCGLKVSALCGDLGGHGFTIEEENTAKIEKSKRIIDLAKDLGTNVVTTHIGVVPANPDHPRYNIMKKACMELGDYAKSMDACFAIETGPEKTETLKHFLDSVASDGIGVNYDPANLVMVTGDDPVKGVYNLKDYIVHTHAKDGIMRKQTDPEVIYNFFASGGILDMRLEDYFIETPLGCGNVDFSSYLKALDEIGYKGFLTIEREVGENPIKDISEAVSFLKGHIL